MGFWDDNPELVPSNNSRFFKFEAPGQECAGKVVAIGVHTWAPKANQKTGVMETKKSPEITFIDATTQQERTLTLPSHLAQLAYENRLDVGDDFRARFTHKDGTTYKFTLQVRHPAAGTAPAQAPLAATGTDAESPW